MAIVIPVANESETLISFYKDIIKNISPLEKALRISVLFIVDNNSIDNSLQIIESLQKRDSRIKLIWCAESKSVVDAYLTGFRAAIESNNDFILEMDAGFSHLPSDIPKVINKLLKGYDCVFGYRFSSNSNVQLSRRRLFYSKAGNLLANFLLGMKYNDSTSGFEAFKKDVLKQLIENKLISKGHFFQTEIKFRAKNFNYAEVPINYTNTKIDVPIESIRNAIWGLLVCFCSRFYKLPNK